MISINVRVARRRHLGSYSLPTLVRSQRVKRLVAKCLVARRKDAVTKAFLTLFGCLIPCHRYGETVPREDR